MRAPLTARSVELRQHYNERRLGKGSLFGKVFYRRISGLPNMPEGDRPLLATTARLPWLKGAVPVSHYGAPQDDTVKGTVILNICAAGGGIVILSIRAAGGRIS